MGRFSLWFILLAQRNRLEWLWFMKSDEPIYITNSNSVYSMVTFRNKPIHTQPILVLMQTNNVIKSNQSISFFFVDFDAYLLHKLCRIVDFPICIGASFVWIFQSDEEKMQPTSGFCSFINLISLKIRKDLSESSILFTKDRFFQYLYSFFKFSFQSKKRKMAKTFYGKFSI